MSWISFYRTVLYVAVLIILSFKHHSKGWLAVPFQTSLDSLCIRKVPEKAWEDTPFFSCMSAFMNFHLAIQSRW